jgi:predicted acetyltransferase
VDIDIRPAVAEDLAEITRLDGAAFGFQYDEQEIKDVQLIVDLDRFLVATVDDEIVGITGDYPVTMTVPGGGGIAVPGVTWVSVRPTHRRRGILRAMMERQLRDYAERGESMAILTASEGAIYGRYGYGPATSVRRTAVDRRLAALAHPVDTGAVEIATKEQARERGPEVHERWRAQVPGAISRSEKWWDFLFLDRDSRRSGLSGLFFLVHPDGYLSYRVKADWADGHAQHVCQVVDYFMVTPEAHSAIWQVLLSMDLFGRIESQQMPLDDPLPFKLTDYRQLRTTAVNDGVWVRPIDVGRTLEARTYGIEIEAVLEVTDPLFGDGRYLLKGGPDGSSCERTDRLPDVQLPVYALGAAYLGGQRLLTLAAAGLVQSTDQAGLGRLDRAFVADRAPFHGTAF